VMVIEVMGHKAGWIALYAGMAGGADVILIPEIPFDIDGVIKVVTDRARRGKPYSIIVVAEGVSLGKKKHPSHQISSIIEEAAGMEARETILGYIQRGGSPTPFDRNLATALGGHATELIANKSFGRMVCVKNGRIDSVPLSEVAGKARLVPKDHDLVRQGRHMGIFFGNE